jgi:hypothetical protein
VSLNFLLYLPVLLIVKNKNNPGLEKDFRPWQIVSLQKKIQEAVLLLLQV